MLKLMKWGSFMIEKFNSKKFFIDLLTSYINGSKIELKDTDSVNWKEVYYLANIHNMVGQLYVVLRNSGIHCDAEIMQNCFNKFTYIVIKIKLSTLCVRVLCSETFILKKS